MTRKFYHNFSGRNLPDYSRKSFDTMLVMDGKIVKTGFQMSIPTEETEIIDLNGKTVFPAFSDAHVHFTQTGISLQGCRLNKNNNLKMLFDMILHETRKSEYVLGWGLQELSLSEKRLPTTKELDDITGKKFAWLARTDLHSAVLNTSALNWARKALPSLTELNGLVEGMDYNYLSYALIDHLSASFKLQGLKKAAQHFYQKGVSYIHALEGSDSSSSDSTVAADFFKTNPLSGIVYHQSPDPGVPLKHGWNGMGGCLLVDGSIGTRTAALNEAYADSPQNTGNLYLDATRIESLVKTAAANNLQLSLHAIGDRAIDCATSVFAWSRQQPFGKQFSQRIEHFVMPTKKSLFHARESSTMVCIQPAFDYFWGGTEGLYSQRLGQERAKTCNSFKTMLDLGIQLAAGSDSPVTPVDPILGVHALVNHSNPDEQIDLNSALSLFISEPHKLSYQETMRGHLKPGYIADFICLSEDPFMLPPRNINKLRVDALYIRAEKISPD